MKYLFTEKPHSISFRPIGQFFECYILQPGDRVDMQYVENDISTNES